MALVAVVLSPACGGDGDGDSDAAPTAPASAAVRAGAADGSKPTAAPTPNESSTSSEPVPFQTPDGMTIQARLLSVAGPNQRVVVIAAPDSKRYEDVYGDLVARGLAVLVFDAPEGDAAIGAMETAVRLARSREYPLVYVVGLESAAVAATAASEAVEADGVLALEEGAVDVETLGDAIRELVSD